VLSRAMGHLEKHTIQPLEEMSQRIQFRIDLLREVNDAQILFLEGGGESGAGLRGVILEARTRQQRSRERLSRLLEIFSEQKETAACILTESLILKSKVFLSQFHMYCIYCEWLVSIYLN
jgi:predicted ATPase with chaperone activity